MNEIKDKYGRKNINGEEMIYLAKTENEWEILNGTNTLLRKESNVSMCSPI